MIKKLKFRLLLLLLLEIYSLRLQAISLESTRYALMISSSLILAMHKSRICIPYVHTYIRFRENVIKTRSFPLQYVLAQRKIYFPIFHLLLLLNCWPGVLNDFSVIITTHQQRNVLNATNMQHTHTHPHTHTHTQHLL